MPGSTSALTPSVPVTQPAPESRPFIRPEPVRNAATLSRASEMGLDLSQEREPVSNGYIPSSGGGIGGGIALAPSPVAIIPTLKLDLEPMTHLVQTKAQVVLGVKQIGDHVLFTARFDNARKVLIAGDFNNWSPMASPLVSGETPGVWATKLPLFPGRYRYRFIVDGKWMTDPNNTYVEANQFGELNNIVEVV